MTKKEENRMIIIDGNSLMNRAFYALPPLTNKEGQHTNGIYGFMTMVFRMLEEYQPSHFAVAFDLKKPTFRHKEYKEYKAGRKKMPPELRDQFEPLKEVLDALGIYRLEFEGFEADDIIGTVAKQGEDRGMDIFIVTGDKDALQLATEKTKIIFTKRGISNIDIYDAKEVMEKIGVSPKGFIDLKGLMGDSSDNIPGIPGVGEKTALKLLKEFESVENLVERTSEISGKKLRDKVEANREKAVLSKRLATIVTNMPIDIDFDQLERKPMETEKALEIFKKLEFHSLMKKIRGEILDEESHGFSAKKETAESFSMKRVEEQKDFIELFHKFSEEKDIVLFSETAGDDTRGGDIAYIAIAMKGEMGYFIEYGDLSEEQQKNFWSGLKHVLDQGEVILHGYHLKNEVIHLKHRGIKDVPLGFDLMIAEYLIEPNKSGYDLEDLVLEYLGESIKTREEVLGKGKQAREMIGVTGEERLDFYRDRIRWIMPLKEKIEERLKEMELYELYEQVEKPLIEVLANMEYDGIHGDRGQLEELQIVYQEKVETLTKTIYELADEEFNINSPKQLGTILFDKLGLPPIKKTKTGYSTNMEVLEKLKGKHKIIEKILEYRQITKLKSTYIDGLLKIIHPVTGKIHSNFNQTVTATGRISSTEPNLQNIPIKLEMGRKLRKVFIPEEGKEFISADYSQIELRVLAHMSGDENLINSFLRDEDIHTRTAAEIFNVEFNEVTSSMRGSAKAVNFGIVYGISDYGLSENLQISRKKAQEYIDNYFKKYPKVKSYMDEMVALAKEKGYVTTLLQRRRYLPDINARNFNLRSFAERTAMNTPIQGSAADIIKIAMIKVYQELEKQGLKARLILQVHDELIVEAPEDERQKVMKIIGDSMENAMDLKVPLKVDMAVGNSWYDLK